MLKTKHFKKNTFFFSREFKNTFYIQEQVKFDSILNMHPWVQFVLFGMKIGWSVTSNYDYY